MAEDRSDEDKISDILLRDDRYKRDAYRFVQEALDFTRRRLTRKGHITGRELTLGVRDLALERFGMMAKTVLNQWGITRTRDVGEIVFILVEEKIMIKQDTDTREDFDNVYDFETAFSKDFKIEIDE